MSSMDTIQIFTGSIKQIEEEDVPGEKDIIWHVAGVVGQELCRDLREFEFP